jgi:DNA polymerase-3 subunit delta
VLVERKPLVEERERRKNKEHWLEKWAGQAGSRALLKEFTTPKGYLFIRWIQEQAQAVDGEFTQEGAKDLAGLVNENPRQAEQEIHKLLAYVNYRRAVEPDDVHNLTSDSSQGDIFAMVDAMSAQDGRKALQILHKLLEEEDPRGIFPMIIRQFRLMIKARELLDDNVPEVNFAKLMNEKSDYVVKKAIRQASQFSLPVLEAVYRRLLEIDEALKTSQMEGYSALDTLVASFTSQKLD